MKQQEKYKQFGFTLAEVLITLGIIGVVAAMTIPTLIANTRGAQYKAKYKKAISSIDQSVRLNKANYGWDFAEVEEPCSGDDFTTHTPDNKMSVCAIFNGNLTGIKGWYRENTLKNKFGYEFNGEVFGVSKGGGQYTVYQLADGTFVGFRSASFAQGCTLPLGEKLQYVHSCTGFIDVNGISKPNKEVKCSIGTTSTNLDTDCIVKDSDVTDIFPIIFHDSTVEPITNAAKYVLKNAK